MYTSQTTVRVRYSETDQMGYVYYGCYATYYEVARVSCLRQLGLTYKELEQSGIMMPVLESASQYVKPARYDDVLSITTFIRKKPTASICFYYEITDEHKVIIHRGKTRLAFVNKQTRRPCRLPQIVSERINTYFE